jgi:hypothetical protein
VPTAYLSTRALPAVPIPIPRSGSIQLNVDGTYLVKPSASVDAFAKHFQSVYNKYFSVDFPPSLAIF